MPLSVLCTFISSVMLTRKCVFQSNKCGCHLHSTVNVRDVSFRDTEQYIITLHGNRLHEQATLRDYLQSLIVQLRKPRYVPCVLQVPLVK